MGLVTSSKFKVKFKILEKNRTSTYRVLLKLDQKQYMKEIARQLSIKYTTLYQQVQQLEAQGYIKRDFRTNFLSYSLTKQGKELLPLLKKPISSKNSPPMKEGLSRSNNLSYEFPILKDNLNAEWQEKKLHGTWWGYKDIITFPVGMTIVKHPNKIYVHFHQFQTEKKIFLSEIMTHIMRGIAYLEQYLRHKKSIEIDVVSGLTKSSECATEMPEQDGNFDKSTKVSIQLQRNAQMILPSEMKSQAWIDHSLGFPEIESNDLLYEEKLLLMPETIDSMQKHMIEQTKIMDKFTAQIELHLSVMEEMKTTLKAIQENLKK